MELARRAFFKAVAGLAAVAPSSLIICQNAAVKMASAVEPDAPKQGECPQFADMLSRMVDRRPHMWYDRVVLKADKPLPQWAQLFREPVGVMGRAGHVKTLLDTNLWNSAGYGFPAPLSMVAQRVGFLISPDANDSDANLFGKHAVFEFRLTDKFLCGGRMDWNIAGERRGSPASPFEKFFDLPQALCIPPMVPWSLDLLFPEIPEGFCFLENDLELFAFLDGVCDFAIQ